MAAMTVFFDGYQGVCRDFPITASRGKCIIGRVVKSAGCVHHYKSLPGNIFVLILAVSLAVRKEFYTF